MPRLNRGIHLLICDDLALARYNAVSMGDAALVRREMDNPVEQGYDGFRVYPGILRSGNAVCKDRR